jgi:hypothetical protein
MSAREIRNAQSSRHLPDLLQSLFSAELFAPGERLWLVSPWISDIPLLDNTAGQFEALAPQWDRAPVRLSQVLAHLAECGTVIHVATRDTERNQAFHATIADAARRLPRRIHLHLDLTSRLHEKGLLADDWYLEGSLNLTYGGIYLNEEKALLHRDGETIAENHIFFAQRWREAKP